MRSHPPPAIAARPPGESGPDLTSLLVTHRAIRQDLARLTARLARDAAPPASAQRRAMRRYAGALFAEIRTHFDDEDGILWPMIAVTAGQCADLAPLTDDHQAIVAALGRAGRAVVAFTGASGGRPPEPVNELREMLDEHIADEDAQILPAMRRYLPAAAYRSYETQAWGRASLASLRFRLPWLARAAGPDELPALLAPGGRRARLLLRVSIRRHARLERRSFGQG